MPDGGHACTHDTLRDLMDVVGLPADVLPHRLSQLLAPFCGHRALVMLAADAAGGHRQGTGDESFVEEFSSLDLDELRRGRSPGTLTRATIDVAGQHVETLQVVSRNGAVLVLACDSALATQDETVLQLWNIVAFRVQELADAASPDYLTLARSSSGERMAAVTELADEYSTTLESVLAALRSPALDDRAARTTATSLAVGGLVHLRTASDRVRTFTEEPVTTAFERLRDDLRPLVRYRDLDVQFVEPPVDGRPLPSEVAHGARAVVRGLILALVDRHDVSRIRVRWGCDGMNLLIDIRDDGPGEPLESSTPLQLVRQRVHALEGRLSVESTPGWGTEVSIVVPLDPPRQAAGAAEWDLRPREREVLRHLASGRSNRDIAAELGISENTVKFHVARIYRALEVGSRAAAAARFHSETASSVR